MESCTVHSGRALPLQLRSGFRSLQQAAALRAPWRRQRLPRAAAAAPRHVLASALPIIEELRGLPPKLKGDSLEKAIEDAFVDTFWGATAAPRVLGSFHRMQAGRDFMKDWPGMGLQHAETYIEGLAPNPFPDPRSGSYPWLEAIEARADEILEEFTRMTADPEALEAKGESIWVAAVRQDALAYGSDWRTLVLQDRGNWEPTNSKLFPVTSRIVKESGAPTLEVFFARQPAGTGIKSHSDYVNFIQTSHLGLDIPEGDCWIKVGNHTRHWEHKRFITMDTSFMHETQNNTEKDRTVLILRHFHPEVTPLERRAVKFLFDCLDEPTPEGIKAAQRRARDALAAAIGGASGKAGGKKKKGGKGGGSSGKGFGGFGKKPAA